MNFLRAFLIFIICGLCSSVAYASSPSDSRNKLQTIESQLNSRQAAAAVLDQKSKETNQDLEDLRHKLIAATEALEVKESQQGHLQDKLDELARDVEAKNSSLAGTRQKFAQLTDAMMELSRQPPESFFLQNGLTDDHIHRMILLRAMLPRMKEQVDILAHDIGTLDELKQQLAEQKRLTTAAHKNLEEQRKGLNQLIQTRQGYLQRTEEQKQAIASQLVSLANEAKDLRQLLDKVTPHKGGKSLPRALNATLKWPVAGGILRRYGEKDSDGVTSEGVTFVGLSGAPVVAPMPGRVVFAGPFRGYGQIMILQHEGGYHSFLAGFGRIDAEVDQDVEAGEPLGVLPVKEGAKPQLYFEWRRNSEPVDPAHGIALSKRR